MSTFIAAFDIATATGVCHGHVGCKAPAVWTWDLSDAGKPRPFKLCYLRRLLDRYFDGTELDAVYYEAPVPLRAMMRIGATDETIQLLRGAIGVLEACAVHAGIKIVAPIAVQDAREALTGQRTFSKGKAKDAVMRTAAMLGVKAANDHEADAYAIWWTACARHNPRIAHVITPLFHGTKAEGV